MGILNIMDAPGFERMVDKLLSIQEKSIKATGEVAGKLKGHFELQNKEIENLHKKVDVAIDKIDKISSTQTKLYLKIATIGTAILGAAWMLGKFLEKI